MAGAAAGRIDLATEVAEGFAVPPFGVPLESLAALTLPDGRRLHPRHRSARFDDEVIPHVTSAHLACGVHSGDPLLIRRTAATLVARGIRLGAHPSYPDAFGFGQRRQVMPDEDVKAVLLYQFGALAAILRGIGARMEHVKCHGALAFDVSYEERFCAVMVDAVKTFDPELIVVLMAGSPGLDYGRGQGLRVASEGYVDRGYDRSGRLVPRDHPQALIEGADRAAARVAEFVCEGKVTCVDGTRIDLHVDTLCLHSDTAGAGATAAAVSAVLSTRNLVKAPLRDLIA
ncbi:MAG: 5-oxoprolinase subunit PxpA [Burkholderiales bacterium]